MNAVNFILFTHHNFKLYLEWSRDAMQGYFAECRMQNGIVLNMQMKWENNLALFFNPLRTIPFCFLHSAKYPCPRCHPLLICTLEAFSFQHLPSRPPHHPPPPPVCPHLLRPTQTHHNRNSKIDFKDISNVQREKSWTETHFSHAKQIIAWENRNFTTPAVVSPHYFAGKGPVASWNVICFVGLNK